MPVSFVRFALAAVAALVGCGPLAAQPGSAISITVTLPGDAELTVNGQRTTATGEVRELRDSQARPGQTYRFRLQAIVERDGRRVAQERTLRLSAGASTRVDFELPPLVVVHKPLELPLPEGDLLAQADDFRSRFQPRDPASDSLPDLSLPPATGGDGFQPRLPDLSAQPEAGPRLPEQPALPPLDTPDESRFGRPLDDEPPLDPAGDERELFPPAQPAESQPPVAPLPASDSAHAKGAAPAAGSVPQLSAAGPSLIAYIGHGQQHHLLGDAGTVLHVWQGRWRMVRTLRSPANSVGYTIFDEQDHAGCAWAYAVASPGCRQTPIFFKPGSDAPWVFMGHLRHVRPFEQ